MTTPQGTAIDGHRRVLRSLVAIAALTAVVAGCASSAQRTAPTVPDSTGYWTEQRLLAATPVDGTHESRSESQPKVAHTPAPRVASLRVGALFVRGDNGNHFCTASVVHSPGGDLLLTAAHCIERGDGVPGVGRDIVFVPGYRDGKQPFGEWSVEKVVIPAGWTSNADPDDDIGFIVVNPKDGTNIEHLLGANRLVTGASPPYAVHVTGYPSSSEEPVSCTTNATTFSPTQQQFECAGFQGGTSGSPWVTNFDRTTHTGDVVGTIGGYEQGGDTDEVSYSVRFGPDVRALYDRAVAAEKALQTRAGTSTTS